MEAPTPPYPAPDFSLVDANDKRISLADFRGSWLVLYFYPADDTPGCTVEACSFRDQYHALDKLSAQVVGISMNTPAEHAAFQKKYGLMFPLLSDPRAETIQKYGAWGKGMFGREGIKRKTFLIDPQGIVCKVYGRVTPLEHGVQVARDLAVLQG